MTPSPQGTGPSLQPLPPLPDVPSGGQKPSNQDQGGMAALLSGIAPIKSAVDQIMAACKSIVQTGIIPGAEQPCGQIVSLATSLLPMAAQSALSPGAGGGQQSIQPPQM
jgi:hypothetical protein